MCRMTSSAECKCKNCKKELGSKLYIRYLNYPFIVEQNVGLISSYILPGVIEEIQKLNKKYRSDYILCVGYSSDFKDFQIGLTGTVHNGEDYKTAAIREMSEEVGFTTEQIKHLRTVFNGKTKSHVYTVQARSLIKNNISGTVGHDDKSNKITILIHGSLEEMTKIMEDITIKPDNSERIWYFAAIKIPDILRICKVIKFRKSHTNNRDFIVKWNCQSL